MSLDLPASDATYTYEKLGQIEAYDAILNADYAFLIYKETERAGPWRVRIKSSQTTGVVFEPDAMKSSARAAGAQGKPFFTWGAGITPSAGDPRLIEYRVHQKDGKPSQIEIALQMRKADHSAGTPQSIIVNWPG